MTVLEALEEMLKEVEHVTIFKIPLPQVDIGSRPIPVYCCEGGDDSAPGPLFSGTGVSIAEAISNAHPDKPKLS